MTGFGIGLAGSWLTGAKEKDWRLLQKGKNFLETNLSLPFEMLTIFF